MSYFQKIISLLLTISILLSNVLVSYAQTPVEEPPQPIFLPLVQQAPGTDAAQPPADAPQEIQPSTTPTETIGSENTSTEDAPASSAAAPGPFAKIGPANGATNVATHVVLSWQSASGAVGYGYCIDDAINTKCDAGSENYVRLSATSVSLTLVPGRTYEWQARAYAADGTWTPGNGSGVWWTFRTNPNGTGPFNKLNPSHGASNVPTTVTLSWQPSANAVKYGYCIDTTLNTTCDVGSANYTYVNGTSATLPLQPGTTYQWQARAYAADSTWTPANGAGVWWTFSTVAGGPAPFGKIAPTRNAQNVATTVTLSWQATTGAKEYAYCLDTNLDDQCDQGSDKFVRVAGTSAIVTLEPNKTYGWQARAYASNGNWTPADGAGQWWRFTTTANGSVNFSKVSPSNGATNVPTSISLRWLPSANAVKYSYCIDTTLNNGCEGGGDKFIFTQSTSVALNLAANTSYEWQARAYAVDGTWTPANGTGQWWRFSTTGSLVSGYTPGEFGVSEAGAANYRIPFVLPPGTAGMTPQIALTYGSGGSNTIVGWGWSLTGLSLISRCPANKAQHGFTDGVDFDGNDQFCMDGQLLVAVSGAYGADQTLYRTENESFSRIKSIDQAGAGPLRFQAMTKAGLTIEYGASAGSRLEAAGRADILYWAVTKIVDTKGNYMTFTYEKNSATGELLPQRIDYTGNAGQNLPPYDRVEFLYELRPDGRVQFIAGTPVRLSKRIQYLRVYAESVLMREFRFGYEVSLTTGRSRLVNLTECGMGGQCVLSSRFVWSSQSTNELNFNGSGSGKWSGHGGGQNDNILGDYNDDGKTDMAGYTGANGRWHVCLSTGSGFACSFVVAHARGEQNTFPGDFDGDGRTDLAAYAGGSDGKWEICLSNGSGFQPCQLWQGHSGATGNNVVADFNGDGRTDIAGFSGNYIWHVCLSIGSNFSCSKVSAHNGVVADNVAADFNGDGMADLAGYTGRDGRWHVCRSTGAAFECSYWTGHAGGAKNNVVGDFNGDGLADMAGHTEIRGQWHLCLSTGTNFECSIWTGHGGGATNNASGDFNGDGLTDMAGYTGSNGQWHVCLSTGAGFTCGNRTWSGHGGGSSNNFSGDYNGDGKTDLAGYTGSNGVWHVTLANDLYPDQLRQFINGHGATTTVAYAPLTNPAVYTKGSGALYPNRDFQAPLYVVSSYATSNGIGGQRQVNYTYTGLRVNQIGRGFLGYASVNATDIETGIKTVTYYRQDHPYKSMAAAVEQFQADGKLMQRVENSWAVMNFAAAARLPSLGMTEQEARALYPSTPEDTQAAAQPEEMAEGSAPDSAAVDESGALSGLGLTQQIFLPAISGGADSVQEDNLADPPDSARADYDFTHFIDAGDSPLPATTETPVMESASTYEPAVELLMEGLEVESASLESMAAPNAQGFTYFVYVSKSVVTKYELNGALIFATTTTNTYDSYGNPTRIVESSSDGYTKTSVNTYVNDTSLWILGRLTSAKVTATAPNQAAQTRTSAFAYDTGSGLLLREESEPNSPLSLVKVYEYDGFGNIIRSTTSGPDIATRSQTSQYGFRGRFMTQSSNALGHTSKVVHDQTLGLPLSITDANGLVTTRKYDGFGRMTEESRPDGSKTTMSYSLCSGALCPAQAIYYVRTESSGRGPSVVYYDLLDRQVRSETVGFNGQPIFVETIYNSRGQAQKASDPYFSGATPQWTSYTYDLLGRTLTESRPNGAVTNSEYTGFTVQMVNPLGQANTRVVNSQGWLMRSTDTLSNTTRYTYDSFGNLLTLVDRAGNTTTMEYDLRGRKISMRDPDSGTVTYRYNALNELIGQTDAKKQSVALTYDLLGRMIQRTETEGVSTWVYDSRAKGIGMLAEVRGPNGYTESYTYDALSRPVKVTYGMSGQTFVVENSFDSYGRIAKISYPGGFRIRNEYTEQGYLKEVRNDATNTLFWRADTLNARGQLEQATLGNSLVTKQRFDAQTGFLRTIQTGPTSAPGQVQNLAFAFDAVGNLTSRSDQNQSLTEAFTYDRLNRLIKAQVNTRTADTVRYDILGNITFKSDVGSYTYGGNGAGPHAVTAIFGGISASFVYDANGNRIQSNGGSIAYTSFNLPATLVQGSNRITYAYGPGHERYKRTVQTNGVTTTTLMIGTLYEKVTVGALTTQNYYIPAAGQMIAIHTVRSNGTTATQYLHRDHLGSITAITDATGKVIEQQNYDAWGKRRTSDWRAINSAITSVVRRGYTGHEQLDEVGLIHMNGRVYDPTLGRFLSPDPFIQAPEFSQSLNRYSYVLNNPLSLTDPSGFFSIGKFIKKVGDFFEKHWVAIVAVAVTIFTAGWASGFTAAFWGSVFGANTIAAGVAIKVTGALVGGFAGSVVSSLLHGGSLSEALRTGFKEGVVGALRRIDTLVSNVLLPSWNATQTVTSTAARLTIQMARTVTRGVISGTIAELLGGDFSQGFRLRFAAESVRWAIEAYTGSPLTWKRATQEPEVKSDGQIKDFMSIHANHIGMANKNLSELADPCFGCEGGPVSRFANLFPGMNSGAVLHDHFAGDMENPSKIGWLDKILNGMTNQATIVPVIGVNYIGLGSLNALYEARLVREQNH